MMPAVLAHDVLGDGGFGVFSSLTTGYGGTCAARLFKFDAETETLAWEWTFYSTGWYYWFASPAADYSDSAYWVFTRTGPGAGQEAEIRYVDYNQGVFSNSSTQVIDGAASLGPCYDDEVPPNVVPCRWGDYFGGQIDWGDYLANLSEPGRPAKVWLYAEYALSSSGTSGWGTRVMATSVWNQGVLSSVSPAALWEISGDQGGPFSNTSEVYTLTNSGEVGLSYEVWGLPPWLNASPASGQLFPGTVNVTLSLNTAVAQAMGAGTYNATVVFRDCYNGGASFSRDVRLTILAPPEIVAWHSLRYHYGSINNYLPIVLDPSAIGAAVVSETRRDGIQWIEVNFSEYISGRIIGAATAEDLTHGGSIVATTQYPAYGGYTLEIGFSPGLPDETCYRIDLAGVIDGLVGDTDCRVRCLIGDVNGDQNTNLIDMAFVKSKNGAPVLPDNIRFDANLDGAVNLIDMALVKSLNGHSVSCP
jgi:hypothetical protein